MHGRQRKTYKVLIDNHVGYRPFVRPTCRWKDVKPFSVQCQVKLDGAYSCMSSSNRHVVLRCFMVVLPETLSGCSWTLRITGFLKN